MSWLAFGYWIAWTLVWFVLRSPWLLIPLVLLVLARPFLPTIGALFRLLSRARALRAQVAVNRANVTARRDLAMLYLEGRRHRSAVRLLEEGLALKPNDPELLYLWGLALHRVGRHEEALAPLVRAVDLDARVRFGLPYATAGDALCALRRWDEAVDAYERYMEFSSSDVSGYTRLARARCGAGDREGAANALHEGLRTFGVLPGSMKRRQFGHYLAAQRARVTLLREPGAIVVTLALAVALVVGFRFTHAPAMRLLSALVEWSAPAGMDADSRASFDGEMRCGSQSTGDFVGHYVIDASDKPSRRGESYDILGDRIVNATTPREEFCLTRTLARDANALVAEALWHEDVNDPGDACIVRLTLRRVGAVTLMRFDALDEANRGAFEEIRLQKR